MLDILLYFLRRNRLLLYIGLSIFALLYSSLVALYFFHIPHNILFALIFIASLWIAIVAINLSTNREKYTYGREKERHALLRHQITQEYQLDIDDNIFAKVDLVMSLIKERFSTKGLLSMRTMKLVDSSLALYIENLKIKKELLKADAISSASEQKEFYREQIAKNNEQNRQIEQDLENLIQELMKKNSNDREVEHLLSELENATKLLSKIS